MNGKTVHQPGCDYQANADDCPNCRGQYQQMGSDIVFMGYKPRFVTVAGLQELSELYRLARTALAGQDNSRYQRRLWAAREFAKNHPEVSETAAYKDLDGMLEVGFWD